MIKRILLSCTLVASLLGIAWGAGLGDPRRDIVAVTPANLTATSATVGAVGSCPGDALYLDQDVLGLCGLATDAAPGSIVYHSADAHPGGTQTPAPTYLRGGLDEHKIVIDAYASCEDDTVGIIIDGSTNTLTEGEDAGEWDAATSNAATCTNLAARVDALTGVSATCSTATVLIFPYETGVASKLVSLALTESDPNCTGAVDGTEANVVVSTGQLEVPLGTAALPTHTFRGDTNTGIFSSGANTVDITANGATLLQIFSGSPGQVRTQGSATLVATSNMRMSSTVDYGSEATTTLAGGATTFAYVREMMTIDCDAGTPNTIATITGGAASVDSMLTMRFIDAHCTITDTGTDASNTVNLSAAFTSSDDDSMTLQWNGTSWREVSRSVN